jgi:hypothetical protein
MEIRDISRYLLEGTEENYEELVRIIGVPAGLRTEYLPSRSPKRFIA